MDSRWRQTSQRQSPVHQKWHLQGSPAAPPALCRAQFLSSWTHQAQILPSILTLNPSLTEVGSSWNATSTEHFWYCQLHPVASPDLGVFPLTKLVARSPQDSAQPHRNRKQVTSLKPNATKTLLWRENPIHLQWSRSERNPGGSLEVQHWCWGSWGSRSVTHPHGESFTPRAQHTLTAQQKLKGHHYLLRTRETQENNLDFFFFLSG